MTLLRGLGWLVLPTFWLTLRDNRRVARLDRETVLNDWQFYLGTAPIARARDATTTLVTSYQIAWNRQLGLEAKGIGVIQAGAIIAAVLVVVLVSSSVPAQIAAGCGIAYLLVSLSAAARLLTPEPREVTTPEEIRASRSMGLAEMAMATQMMDPISIRTNNWVVAALADLTRASALAVIALLLHFLA